MVTVDSRSSVSVKPDEASQPLIERASLVMDTARVLQGNGESTDDTLSAAGRLGKSLDLAVTVIVDWSALHLQADHAGWRWSSVSGVSPTNINMSRVSAALDYLDRVVSGGVAPSAAAEAIRAISREPPAPTWLFTLAAVAGAVALSVISGVEHWSAVALIAVSAGLGAVLRRAVARYSSNTLLQPFCAALVAGVIGALAVRMNLSSSLMLVALCPCLVLVPGPHFLNGTMDLLAARMSLGASRVLFALSIMVAISTGVLLGLALLGESLTVDPPGRTISIWFDVVAAGVAVAAYSVFYSTPPRMWTWPIVFGTLAHALRFVSITLLGANAAAGAFVACLLVGIVMTPVARRYHMPFAAVGFASVVSMLPGSNLIRLASGLVQLGDGSPVSSSLLSATIFDGVTAITVILAMTAGLIVPKLTFDRCLPLAWR